MTSLGAMLWHPSSVISSADLFYRAQLVDPVNPIALMGLGAAYERNANYEKSIEYLSRLLELEPDDSVAALHLAMCQGYTLYLDRGKPVRGQEQATIDLLKRVSMSFYVNVPLGYEMLIDAMERDAELARHFFTTMRFLIFGGAGITAETFQRYDRLAIQIKGEKVPFISAYGSTETTSSVTMTYFDADASGLIGLPLPGLVIKLVPSHGKFELRVKGPNVTPGYLQGSEGLFDTEGFLKTGDLAEWVDQDDFNKGLRFAGRVAEEFKLCSGTWVAGSRLRSQLIDLCTPLVKEVVVCGLNREYVSAMMWPNDQACEQIDAGYDARRPWQSGAVSGFIEQVIRQYNQRNPGSSTCIRRIKLMGDPLSVSMGEISDKGSVNSRRVLETRSDAVNSLYTDEAPGTLTIERN
jgi:feruloyl-CoA synthase